MTSFVGRIEDYVVVCCLMEALFSFILQLRRLFIVAEISGETGERVVAYSVKK